MNNRLLVALACAGFTLFLKSIEPEAQQAWDGAFYHDTHWQIDVPSVIQLLSPIPLHVYSSILDIGCGSGDITAWVARQAPESSVKGIDSSGSMISFAHEQYRGLKNLEFKLGDACQLPVVDPANLIISINAFHWLPYSAQQKALSNCAAIAGDKGRLIILMEGRLKELHPLERAFCKLALTDQWRMLAAVNPADCHYPQDPETFSALLREVGFAPDDVRIIAWRHTFKNLQALKDFIASWIGGFAPLAGFSHEVKMHFVSDLVDAYAQEVKPLEDGSIIYDSPRLYADAHKL
jgi:trans-aconitate methyltransferase